MKYLRGERKKVISGDGFDLETKFNSFVEKLEDDGIKYSSEYQQNVGFIITYESVRIIPETTKDEYELRGEEHSCIECPYYERPTDGRVKNTKCHMVGLLRCGGDDCCEKFYEWLANGVITPIAIGKDVPR